MPRNSATVNANLIVTPLPRGKSKLTILPILDEKILTAQHYPCEANA
jgi:hypothetical protein